MIVVNIDVMLARRKMSCGEHDVYVHNYHILLFGSVFLAI